MMKLKSVLAIVGLVFVGTVNAQEGEAPVPPPPTKPVVVAEIIDLPDVEAEFPGGVEAMSKYIRDNVKYPKVSRDLGDEGRLYVTFVVEKNGSISGVQIMRDGLTPELNEEAKRLVRNMPKWKPAELNNAPVRARCRLPITFTLVSPKKKGRSKTVKKNRNR